MIKVYKTELNLTEIQLSKLKQDIGNCRKVYNIMLGVNKERYMEGEKFLTGYDFSKYLNSIKKREYPYLSLTSSKAIKQSIMNCDKAFKGFFKQGKGFPKFKSKYRDNVSVYLPKNNQKDIIVERHKIKLPTYGYVRLKEKGYLPTKGCVYKSATITLDKTDRAFISLLVEQSLTAVKRGEMQTEGIGIDLGIKSFATLSNGVVYDNVNKTQRVFALEKLLKKINRELSRKKRGSNNKKKVLKRKNKIEKRLTNIRKDFYRKVAVDLVKTNPNFIALEDLNVSSMLRNRHLSKMIGKSNFYNFRVFLESKAKEYNVEIRYVDRFFPSSKTCNSCGLVKKQLSLSERVFKCECGYSLDRDLNAALNIRDFSE